MTLPTITAELFWESQCQLGEGILWDSDTQCLRWVDLKVAEVHSLNPETKAYTVDTYPETQFVNALMLRKNKQDIVGLTQDAVAVLSISTPDSSSATSPKDVKRTEQKIKKIISQPLAEVDGVEMRFNDGGCDPSGRLFAGSTNHTTGVKEKGEFVKVETDGTSAQIFDKISCSNGLGWSPDCKTMYYIDSGVDEIRAFDYDMSTGTLSNKRIFATTPDPVDEDTPTRKGSIFDGMTMDGVGNLWVARWSDSRVMGFKPNGEAIANIKVPGCLMTTIPCFGGKNLDQMYIASANTKWIKGDQNAWPHSGDVFTVDFGPDSEIRKHLGPDWKGAERHRFAA